MLESTPRPWYRLHAWTLVALLISAASLTSAQVFGQLSGYAADGNSPRSVTITRPSPPLVALRFGWPVVYQWRECRGWYQYDDFGNVYTDTPLEYRWAWNYGWTLEYSLRLLTFNICMTLMLLLGVGYSIERFCRRIEASARFGFVSLLGLAGWAATLLVVDGEVKTGEDAITISVRVLLSLRFLILAIFWFGLVDAWFRLMGWLSRRRSTARST